MKTTKKCGSTKPCFCPKCNTRESIRKEGRRIFTNLCHALGGICNVCLAKQEGLAV